jgi:hypothetical protein
MSDEPNIDALLDKGFGIPPAADADNSASPTPAAPETPADTTPEVPSETPEPTVDASVILMREDYSRKMHEVGEQRRAIEAEKARLRDLQAFADRLEADADFRSRIEQAVQSDGQAPSPVADPYAQRIARLEQTIAEQKMQAHYDAVDSAASRVAAEFKLSGKDTEAVITSAVRAGVLHGGVPNQRVYDVLSMAAARHVLPRAAANGQRDLLDQLKDKGRAATPVAEHRAPPEPEPDVTKMSETQYQKYLISLAEKAGRGTS